MNETEHAQRMETILININIEMALLDEIQIVMLATNLWFVWPNQIKIKSIIQSSIHMRMFESAKFVQCVEVDRRAYVDHTINEAIRQKLDSNIKICSMFTLSLSSTRMTDHNNK